MGRGRGLRVGLAAAVGLVAATLPNNSDLEEPKRGVASTVDVASAGRRVQTGDLVLYDSDTSRYRNWRLIAQIHVVKTWTSRWDHIGLVVRGRALDEPAAGSADAQARARDPPPIAGRFEVCSCATGSCDGRCEPFVLEATAKGVHLFPFGSRVASYRSREVAVRPISFERTGDVARALDEFLAEVRDKPYNKHPWDLLCVWLRLPNERLKAARIERLERALGHIEPDAPISSTPLDAAHRDYGLISLAQERRNCPKETLQHLRTVRVAGEEKIEEHALLCSELVALAYQRMGVLRPHWPVASKYCPGDFLSSQRVPLLPHARFESPVPVDLPSRAEAPSPAPALQAKQAATSPPSALYPSRLLEAAASLPRLLRSAYDPLASTFASVASEIRVGSRKPDE
eukprot:tig00000227_g19848.t1